MYLLGFIALVILVVFGVPRFMTRKPKAEKTEQTKTERANIFLMRLLGGPADGTVEKIVEDKRPDFFVAVYPPKLDENGQPPEENIVGHMYGKFYVRPNYAYYKQITDEDYFYVRDLSEKEMQKIAVTGELPEVQPRIDDAEEE